MLLLLKSPCLLFLDYQDNGGDDEYESLKQQWATVKQGTKKEYISFYKTATEYLDNLTGNEAECMLILS